MNLDNQIADLERQRRDLLRATTAMTRTGRHRLAGRCERNAHALAYVIRTLKFIQPHRALILATVQAAEHPATRAVLTTFPDAEIHSIKQTKPGV